MKVKDLTKALKDVDPELDVFCPSRGGEYEYCLVNSLGIQGLNIEGEEDEIKAFIVDEE